MNHQTSTEENKYPPLASVTKAMWMMGGVGRGTIYRMLDSGDLESVKSGSRRFVLTSSILDYIESLKAS
jgi:excisionase family DNA binding protein